MKPLPLLILCLVLHYHRLQSHLSRGPRRSSSGQEENHTHLGWIHVVTTGGSALHVKPQSTLPCRPARSLAPFDSESPAMAATRPRSGAQRGDRSAPDSLRRASYAAIHPPAAQGSQNRTRKAPLIRGWTRRACTMATTRTFTRRIQPHMEAIRWSKTGPPPQAPVAV